MKRWRVAFLLALSAALPILFAGRRTPGLLEDSDTRGILDAIRAAHDPFKWFRGDWPIQNGFYRPVVSLVFEADNALWGTNAAGYGLTNALLCFLCPLLLFWLLRELTDRPWVATAGAALFAFWNVNLAPPLSSLAAYAAWATLAVGAWRHRKAWRLYLPAFLTLLALSAELLPIRSLAGSMIDWIPGRTASTMTVFALAAMAAYARFERLRLANPTPDVPTPETPPATRSSEALREKGVAWPWAAVAIVATALAMGTYEQAVMIPAALAVVAIAFRVGGARPLWALHGAFWTVLLVYAALRWQLLPHVASGYQKQQFRSSQSVFWAEMEYLFPPLNGLVGIPLILESGFLMLLQTSPYTPLISTVTTAVGYFQARRDTTLLLVGWIGSAVAFLPMAWFKIFEHYHYWPMALRAAFVVAIGAAAFRLMATAWSPPARPAPPRPCPAPGSLPRP